MAFSANILSQNRLLIPLDLPPLNSRHPNKLISTKSSSLHQNLQRLSVSSSSSSIKVASDIQLQETSSDTVNKNWGDFASNVSGEWDGHGADFTVEGKPLELPENVVPEAFREWEVKVFDWQTQCPTLAKSEENALFYKLIKLLPTVGCEADAATQHSVDEKNIGGVHNKVSAFAYNSSGCYVAVWPKEDNGEFRLLELEYCLVDPQNRESRVRIIQVIRLDKAVFSLQSIRVFCEQWYGPFRNGEQLGGCAIRDSAFAATDATKGSEVTGAWHGSIAVSSLRSQNSILQELVDHKPQKLVRDDQGLVTATKAVVVCTKKRA
ncbi:hypothetical protein IFM89_024527 [Coptis chinensis]|uniref:Uncharacterized protein n=1 Tax=Coptis chinensis TaxID=261450 RepID=A0A835HLU0_9MAGN|nr:hypothetical protein IFM89_024527 [Coptis chinensis]